MNNEFDIANYPDSEPNALVAGRRWAWVRNDISEVYPTSDFTLKYTFTDPSNTATQRTFTASKIDSKHVVEQASASTAVFDGLEYLVNVEIVRDSDSETIVVDERVIEVKKDGSGSISYVYKVLLAVRALIAGKATQDNKSMTINGRSLERYSPDEWSKIEKEYAHKWAREKQQLDMANGRKGKQRTQIRMGA